MKLANFLLFFVLLFCANASSMGQVPEVDLQDIVDALDKKDWLEAKNLLSRLEENSSDANLLWAVWYDGENNPLHDPVRSRVHLEIAYGLGSKEAQLLLVSKYLLSKDPNITDYKKGVELAKDLANYYQSEIDANNDDDGEMHRIVGKFYLFGTGVEKNIEHGMHLIEKAADLGDLEAIEIVQRNRD